MLSNLTRKGLDFCYRFGGDEFALLITVIDRAETHDFSETLGKRISGMNLAGIHQGHLGFQALLPSGTTKITWSL
jgi:GGDEF domain-containing protein